MKRASALLGGLAPATFLRRHWQKKPLLVRQAIPGFHGFVSRDDLLVLAATDGAAARVVVEAKRNRWASFNFNDVDIARLDGVRSWTALVQGVESLHPAGWRLLSRFDFVPRARVDDLMISFAKSGGSVGPHVDRYDVFLLQGSGRRRWRYDATPRVFVDDDFDARQSMRVLRSSRAWDCDEVLEPGDMLYLPPNVAHWGEAVDDCFTYSIGFLAPSHDAIVQNFMVYFAQVLEGRVDVDALYADPDLAAPRDSFAVDDAMIARLEHILRATRFTISDVADFAGRYFTGPKPSARFSPPSRPPSLDAFARRVRSGSTKHAIALALPSRGLVRGRRVFLNGDAIDVDDEVWRAHLARLFRERVIALPIGERAIDADVLNALHAWFCAGWLGFTRP